MPKKHASYALLLVDFLNPMDFTSSKACLSRAVAAAKRTARLKAALKKQGVPAIYANDHWGEWTHNFDDVLAALKDSRSDGRVLAEILAPEKDDYRILKPRHSAFYGTPLEFLLEELKAKDLIVTGIAADNCVFFTASDAYLRQYRLHVPSDCVVSESDRDRLAALRHMQRILKADTAGSSSFV